MLRFHRAAAAFAVLLTVAACNASDKVAAPAVTAIPDVEIPQLSLATLQEVTKELSLDASTSFPTFFFILLLLLFFLLYLVFVQITKCMRNCFEGLHAVTQSNNRNFIERDYARKVSNITRERCQSVIAAS